VIPGKDLASLTVVRDEKPGLILPKNRPFLLGHHLNIAQMFLSLYGSVLISGWILISSIIINER